MNWSHEELVEIFTHAAEYPELYRIEKAKAVLMEE